MSTDTSWWVGGAAAAAAVSDLAPLAAWVKDERKMVRNAMGPGAMKIETRGWGRNSN